MQKLQKIVANNIFTDVNSAKVLEYNWFSLLSLHENNLIGFTTLFFLRFVKAMFFKDRKDNKKKASQCFSNHPYKKPSWEIRAYERKANWNSCIPIALAKLGSTVWKFSITGNIKFFFLSFSLLNWPSWLSPSYFCHYVYTVFFAITSHTGSSWYRVSFLHSIPYEDVFWICG